MAEHSEDPRDLTRAEAVEEEFRLLLKSLLVERQRSVPPPGTTIRMRADR